MPPVLTLIESRIPWEKRDSIDSESMSPPDLGMTSTGVVADGNKIIFLTHQIGFRYYSFDR